MQLILIGGAQRSGTTLLQTLLANALNSPILPEAHILHDILATYRRAKQFGIKTGFFYATEGDLLSFFQSFARRHVADIVARAGNSTALVLKDPSFIQSLGEAAAVFPRSIRIVCLRDPRDIAASFLKIGERELSRRKTGKYGKRDIGFICRKILSSYSPLLGSEATANAIMVRYEELASDPRKVLLDLARETGLAISLGHLENPVWLAADARHDASWITELEGRGASPASIGSFQQILREDEIITVQTICEPIMSRFGYTPVAYPPPPPPRFGYGILRHFRSQKRSRARQNKTGG